MSRSSMRAFRCARRCTGFPTARRASWRSPPKPAPRSSGSAPMPGRARASRASPGARRTSPPTSVRSRSATDGDWTEPFELVRNLCLFGAAAAGVAAIDTVYTDFRDLDGLRRECEAAARDGFSGKLAIHPDQVRVINDAFTPRPEAHRACRARRRRLRRAASRRRLARRPDDRPPASAAPPRGSSRGSGESDPSSPDRAASRLTSVSRSGRSRSVGGAFGVPMWTKPATRSPCRSPSQRFAASS